MGKKTFVCRDNNVVYKIDEDVLGILGRSFFIARKGMYIKLENALLMKFPTNNAIYCKTNKEKL